MAVLDRVRDGAAADDERLAHYRVRLPALEADADLAVRGRVRGWSCPATTSGRLPLDDLGDRATAGALGASATVTSATWPGAAVAVVGARACTPYGEHVAAELASGLGDRGWTVVSGGAYGIDAAAHRGALAVDGPTVAVLACGVDVAYPAAHDGLLRSVRACGAVVSELPPGARPTRRRFLDRNRVIAALGRGTVVVEAAIRSGALNTAGHAEELSRTVMAVPGPVTSRGLGGLPRAAPDPRGRPGHRRRGRARPGRRPASLDASDSRRGERRPHDGLDPVALRVLEALPVQPPGAGRQRRPGRRAWTRRPSCARWDSWQRPGWPRPRTADGVAGDAGTRARAE